MQKFGLLEIGEFAQRTLDSLHAHVAVLDSSGLIRAVNTAWTAFALENNGGPACNTGTNYIDICDNAAGDSIEGAAEMAEGIRRVIGGLNEEFQLEYPCHSPDQQRWFVGRVSAFLFAEQKFIVVAHENITERKLAEAETQKANAELKKAFAEVRELHGILPICAKCKCIRNDKGFWQSVDSYFNQHSEVQFSHGLCSSCSDELYGMEADT